MPVTDAAKWAGLAGRGFAFLFQPRQGAKLPLVAGEFLVQRHRDLGKLAAVVRRRITTDGSIVGRLGRKLRIWKLLKHLRKVLFGCLPIFFHERYSGETHFQKCVKLLSRQISFEALSLVSVHVHHQNGRRPNGVKAAKILGIVLDVDVERNEIIVDEGRQTGVAIRLVLEPLAGTSRRCGAEVDQQWARSFLSLSQCLVGIGYPVDGHKLPPLNRNAFY